MRTGSSQSQSSSSSSSSSRNEDTTGYSLFKSYADMQACVNINGEKCIGGLGLDKLCEDMGLSPCDPEILVFCKCCGAEEMGTFTFAEFSVGLKELQIKNFCDLQKIKSQLVETLSDPTRFRSIYRFVFPYALEPNHKTLDIHSALEYWKLLLMERSDLPFVNNWFHFVEDLAVESPETQISKDVWNSTYDILRVLNSEEKVKNFSLAESAWPSLLDMFLEKLQSQME